MKKILFMMLSGLFAFWLICLFNYDHGFLKDAMVAHAQPTSSTRGVTLTVDVQDYLNFITQSGGQINFGPLQPNTPVCNGSGTVFVVATNASNGYKMTPSDNQPAGQSPLLHADGTTYIPDISATIGSQQLWVDGTTKGLGLSLFSGAQKEAVWGTGTTACDAYNKWAGVPQTSAATTGHTVTGYVADSDTTYWGWKVDVTIKQRTGLYTGVVTFTVVNVLS